MEALSYLEGRISSIGTSNDEDSFQRKETSAKQAVSDYMTLAQMIQEFDKKQAAASKSAMTESHSAQQTKYIVVKEADMAGGNKF